MIWIFDLDETLYNEKDFVISGLNAVAKAVSADGDEIQEKAFGMMLNHLSLHGRGTVFQKLLSEIPDIKYSVDQLLNIYRTHDTDLNLYADAKELLIDLKVERKYLVTDGNRDTQRSKIAALKIDSLFNGIYVTDEHGEGAAKPGTKCFEMIKEKESCRWDEMVYVGDDPNKDFISLKARGALTIRVNRGRFRDFYLDKEHEAEITVSDLRNLQRKLPLG